MSETQQIVDAINDLTRVVIATQGTFTSRSETIRKLLELNIPASRVASILSVRVNDVTSVVAKDKRRSSKEVNANAA